MKYGIKSNGNGRYIVNKLDYKEFMKDPKPQHIPNTDILKTFINIRSKDTFFISKSIDDIVGKELREINNVR